MSETHTPGIVSHYLSDAFVRENVARFLHGAKKLVATYDFDAFAFQGMSGALIAPLLAYENNKSLIMVRKPKFVESDTKKTSPLDHSAHRVEGDLDARRYIIVDDFTASGTTVHSIASQIRLFAPLADCLGCIFYGRGLVSGHVELETLSRNPYFPQDFMIPYWKRAAAGREP